jgi:hypothetical protein
LNKKRETRKGVSHRNGAATETQKRETRQRETRNGVSHRNGEAFETRNVKPETLNFQTALASETTIATTLLTLCIKIFNISMPRFQK